MYTCAWLHAPPLVIHSCQSFIPTLRTIWTHMWFDSPFPVDVLLELHLHICSQWFQIHLRPMRVRQWILKLCHSLHVIGSFCHHIAYSPFELCDTTILVLPSALLSDLQSLYIHVWAQLLCVRSWTQIRQLVYIRGTYDRLWWFLYGEQVAQWRWRDRRT